ncbi:MAG: hypothetical protein HY677_02195, partial [Chloroflexi bacterium]|nr:hypothetical protein [Chloroflexota bacterium]
MLAARFFSSLRSNLGLAALALLLSASLWIFITGEQNPPRSDTFAPEIPVEPVNVPKDLDVLGAIPSVRVRVRAPEDVWGDLSASNFTATVDLSGQDAGTKRVPVNVRSRSKQVRVLNVLPDRVEVRLEALKRQTVPVKVNLLDSPPFGYTFETPQVTPEKVTVLGPESILSQVDFAVADVSLASEKVTIERSYRL